MRSWTDDQMRKDFPDWPIEDLFAIPTESFVDKNGVPSHCIFNRKLDAVTFVGPEEYFELKARGMQEMSKLPD